MQTDDNILINKLRMVTLGHTKASSTQVLLAKRIEEGRVSGRVTGWQDDAQQLLDRIDQQKGKS